MPESMKNGVTRRDLLGKAYLGLGSLALLDLMAAESLRIDPLRAREQQVPAKAKSCIFLFMEGGVSQMDTFEYKPALEKYAGKRMPQAANTVGEIATFSAAPNRVIPSYWRFDRHGQSGRWMSELLPNLAGHVDDLAFIHGVKVDNNNHGPAVYHALTGNQLPGSASVGAWVTYGLGSENNDLPGYIVLGDHRGSTIGGAGVWGRAICQPPIRALCSVQARLQSSTFGGDPVSRRGSSMWRWTRCAGSTAAMRIVERTPPNWKRGLRHTNWHSGCSPRLRNWLTLAARPKPHEGPTGWTTL